MPTEKLDNLINEIIDKISAELKDGFSEDAVALINALTDLIEAKFQYEIASNYKSA